MFEHYVVLLDPLKGLVPSFTLYIKERDCTLKGIITGCQEPHNGREALPMAD
jgi:hypothetical protein